MNYDDAEGDNQFFIMKRVKTLPTCTSWKGGSYKIMKEWRRNTPVLDERVGHR